MRYKNTIRLAASLRLRECAIAERAVHADSCRVGLLIATQPLPGLRASKRRLSAIG
jgi:hypothetical protein